MSPEIPKQNIKRKSINILMLFLVLFSLLMLILASQLTYTVLSYDKLYNGVYIDDFHVGKMSENEVSSLLKSSLQGKLESVEITLKAEDISTSFNLKDLDAIYDFEKAVEDAYNVGRSGNVFKRLNNIFIAGRKGEKISIAVSYNRKKLEDIIESLHNVFSVNVKEADLIIEDDKVTIVSGHSGKSFDKNKIITDVENIIHRVESQVVNIPIALTAPNNIDVNEFIKQINIEPANATLKYDDNTVKVIPHRQGRYVERSTLVKAVSELNKSEDTVKVIQIKYIEPEITSEKMNSMIFRDSLGTMNTWFNTSGESNKNRSENIRIASSKINGKILAPGEIFSFNEVVGPRTVDAGYKEAHIYVAGEIVDGIGGGICQVSSTLYNAALFADLEIVERSNHMFTVGYVPFGRDATVSYGGPDFKFKNSTNWPLKIETQIKDNNIYFTITGTNEKPSKQIYLYTKQIKSFDYPTEYIDVPDMPEGQTEIKQSGKNGYIVDTYKVIKEDGKTVEEIKLHTSSYSPVTEQILRGTKPVDTNPDNENLPEDEIKDNPQAEDNTEENANPENESESEPEDGSDDGNNDEPQENSSDSLNQESDENDNVGD